MAEVRGLLCSQIGCKWAAGVDRFFDGNDYDELQALQQTTDGGYTSGGWSFSMAGRDKAGE